MDTIVYSVLRGALRGPYYNGYTIHYGHYSVVSKEGQYNIHKYTILNRLILYIRSEPLYKDPCEQRPFFKFPLRGRCTKV